MAVARIDPIYARRNSVSSLRAKPVEHRARIPRRLLVVGVIVAGGALQHVLATTPAEPQPTPLAIATDLAAPAPVRGAHAATPQRAPSPRPAVRPMARSRPSPLPAAPHTSAPRSSMVDGIRVAPRPSAPQARRSVHSPWLPPVGEAGDALRLAIAPNPDGAIVHAPSVSVAAIRAALRDAGSPALEATYADGKDAAEYIWDSGRVLGIDPAVVMAIFRYESMFGTRGVARLTNSVGNIRPLDGQPSLDGYRLYASWQEGIDDCFRLLRRYAHNGAPTVAQAIPTWAPASDDNDPEAYVASVLDIMSGLYKASARS